MLNKNGEECVWDCIVCGTPIPVPRPKLWARWNDAEGRVATETEGNDDNVSLQPVGSGCWRKIPKHAKAPD
jgi:hypothetical protein